MTRPYHQTRVASQGNAFTTWRDGAPSCMASIQEENRARKLAEKATKLSTHARARATTATKPLVTAYQNPGTGRFAG